MKSHPPVSFYKSIDPTTVVLSSSLDLFFEGERADFAEDCSDSFACFCALVFGTAKRASKLPQNPPAICAIVEAFSSAGCPVNSCAIYKIKIRINESGISFFEIDEKAASSIIKKAMSFAPSIGTGEKHAATTPETNALIVIIRTRIGEPYLSSMSGPKSKTNEMFEIKCCQFECPKIWRSKRT